MNVDNGFVGQNSMESAGSAKPRFRRSTATPKFSTIKATKNIETGNRKGRSMFQPIRRCPYSNQKPVSDQLHKTKIIIK